MVKQALLSQKDELEQRIASIKADFRQGRSQDVAEQATENENHEVLMSLCRDAEIELEQIQIVLKQIENDRYGTCLHCGEAISSERLHAMPLASECIECAQ